MSDAVQNDWMSCHYPMAWLPYTAYMKIANHIDGSLGLGCDYMRLAELLGYDVSTSMAMSNRSEGNRIVSFSPTMYLLQCYKDEGGTREGAATIQMLQKALVEMKHVAADVIPIYIPIIEKNHQMDLQQTGFTSIEDTEGSQCNCQECPQRQRFNVNCHCTFVPLSAGPENESINPNLSPKKNKEYASCNKSVYKSIPSIQIMDQPTKKEQRPTCLSKRENKITNECNTNERNEENGSERNVTFRPTPVGSSETDNTSFITCSNPQVGEETSIKSVVTIQMESCGIPCINENNEETFIKSVVTNRIQSCGIPRINDTMAHHHLNDTIGRNVKPSCFGRKQNVHCIDNLTVGGGVCQLAQNSIKKSTASNASESRKADKSSSTIRHSWPNQCNHSNNKSHLPQSSSDSQLMLAPNLLHKPLERDFEQSYNHVTSNSDNCDQNFVKRHTQSSNIQNQNSLFNRSNVNMNRPRHSHDPKNDRNKLVFITYSYNSLVDSELFLEEVINLCRIFKQAGVCVRIDMDAASYRMIGVTKNDWLERMFKEASFIIACVTPTYGSDVQCPTGNKANPSASPLNARYIYDMIHEEYVQNQCQNYRVIPVLFKHSGADSTHVPPCMLSTYVYSYPDHIEKIVSRVI